MPQTRSKSLVVTKGSGDSWANEFAERIDATISGLVADHDVVSVAITTIYASHYSEQAPNVQAARDLVSTTTHSVIVTVVWRED